MQEEEQEREKQETNVKESQISFCMWTCMGMSLNLGSLCMETNPVTRVSDMYGGRVDLIL